MLKFNEKLDVKYGTYGNDYLQLSGVIGG